MPITAITLTIAGKEPLRHLTAAQLMLGLNRIARDILFARGEGSY
jgi:hypothetical protein